MKMTAAKSVLEVLASWQVRHLYGIPGSSVNGLMAALFDSQSSIQYVQVRHEGAGAMAAAGHAKATRQIGACFGSAAPGGTNLMNGLYDAKMDRVPLLALVGQVATENMGTNFFQEMDEVPVYADVSVYNRMAASAAEIPNMVEEAIRTAYERQGVAVVILPNNLMETEIDYAPRKEKKAPPAPYNPPIRDEDVAAVGKMLQKAQRPVLYAGLGLRGARDIVVKMSEQFALPIVTSASAIGVAAPNNHKNFMGSFGRLGTKPAFEVLNEADLVLFCGSNFPFARYWPKGIRVVQINNSPADIGKQIPVEKGIVAHAGAFLQRLIDTGATREEGKFLQAARKAKEHWEAWLNAVADSDESGLTPEGVIKAIRQHAAPDAFFGLDVGNNTIHSVRMLPLHARQQHILSGWFATLGVALPYATSAKLHSPNRQVFSISGDGGFAMNMQEIITQALYKLPVINVVIDNGSYGFIEHAQILGKFNYGVKLPTTSWAATAEGMGAVGFTAKNLKELHTAMDAIDDLQKQGDKRPVLLDTKTPYSDPMDTSNVTMDPHRFTKEDIAAYTSTYRVSGQPSLQELYEEL